MPFEKQDFDDNQTDTEFSWVREGVAVMEVDVNLPRESDDSIPVLKSRRNNV